LERSKAYNQKIQEKVASLENKIKHFYENEIIKKDKQI
jgi:hypothetical protein